MIGRQERGAAEIGETGGASAAGDGDAAGDGGHDGDRGGRRPAGGGPGRRWTRVDASMSLLADLFAEKGIDPGYAEAAARRRAAGRTGARPGRDLRVFAVLVVAGLLAGVAVIQVHRIQPVAQRQRDRLIGEIRTRTGQLRTQQKELDALRAGVGESRRRALTRGDAGRDARRRLNRLTDSAAAAPVLGDGLVITLDEAENARAAPPSGDASDTGRLLDQDLQQLVNGLWAAGAGAIGINGRRLTATTAIRSAGAAILVDFRPLSPPYVVSATGDPGNLREGFEASPAVRHLRALRDSFGIRFDIRAEDELRVPAAPSPRLRHAREAEQ